MLFFVRAARTCTTKGAVYARVGSMARNDAVRFKCHLGVPDRLVVLAMSSKARNSDRLSNTSS
eukprot:565473-Pleurochrysis_carterae.AAC.7